MRTFRIKQGQNKAFEEGVKMAIDGYTKSHSPFVVASDPAFWTPKPAAK